MYGQFDQHLSIVFKILGKALQHFVLLSDSKLIWRKDAWKSFLFFSQIQNCPGPFLKSSRTGFPVFCSSLGFKIALVKNARKGFPVFCSQIQNCYGPSLKGSWKGFSKILFFSQIQNCPGPCLVKGKLIAFPSLERESTQTQCLWKLLQLTPAQFLQFLNQWSVNFDVNSREPSIF